VLVYHDAIFETGVQYPMYTRENFAGLIWTWAPTTEKSTQNPMVSEAVFGANRSSSNTEEAARWRKVFREKLERFILFMLATLA
jgi:hypothetical protein